MEVQEQEVVEAVEPVVIEPLIIMKLLVEADLLNQP